LVGDDGHNMVCAAQKDAAVDLSLWKDALSTVVVDYDGRDMACGALKDAAFGQSLWQGALSTVVVDYDGRSMALLDREPSLDLPDKAWTGWLSFVVNDLTGLGGL
jgi:hypothetical protein